MLAQSAGNFGEPEPGTETQRQTTRALPHLERGLYALMINTWAWESTFADFSIILWVVPKGLREALVEGLQPKGKPCT